MIFATDFGITLRQGVAASISGTSAPNLVTLPFFFSHGLSSATPTCRLPPLLPCRREQRNVRRVHAARVGGKHGRPEVSVVCAVDTHRTRDRDDVLGAPYDRCVALLYFCLFNLFRDFVAACRGVAESSVRRLDSWPSRLLTII